MTRALNNDETYQSHGGKIPLKWTAPEVNRMNTHTNVHTHAQLDIVERTCIRLSDTAIIGTLLVYVVYFYWHASWHKCFLSLASIITSGNGTK